MRSAVLFLVFNRPDTTRQVFEKIRAARPPRLYISGDGPRADRAGESELCSEVRHIATAVDWPCEVRTRFLDRNHGCKIGVTGGISWFFEHEEDGIILEDDVLPLPSFFDYCDELLERYRDDPRVGMISGSNLVSSHFTSRESYFFSRYVCIWGWASWRRVWQHYDMAIKMWPSWRDSGGLRRLSDGNQLFESYWRDKFDSTHRGDIDTWDYQWAFTCWHLGLLNALPAYNQTHNFGFGPSATHTTGYTPAYVADSSLRLLSFPLVHPEQVERNQVADALIGDKVFGINRR